MQPEERDAAYLWDMLDAALAVRTFTAGLTFEAYIADRKVQLAVERALEIIGEAAHHVSEAFRRAHPEIRWRSIIAQRNVLAHEYGAIKQDRIWNVATVHVPELIDRLREWLPPTP
ncbi:MAG TPA: DUF86 domain-containing protein [Anaerolineae bacterium]|nr:DUF86 domain-containing protein [Anaerolineae bacterium]HPL28146.1 DUF86 domain-containing protein [Anaerolineae bacterium]